MMKAVSNARRTSLAAVLLTISIFSSVEQGLASGHPTPRAAGRMSESITGKPQPSGVLSWLESLLPNGIRFTGPAISSKNQSEVLATANCFNSGAGISCNGFQNMQEYVAAVRVSQNLGIPFETLKAKVQSGKTLHQAIHELRPGVNSRMEALKAEQQAEKILKDFTS